MLEEHCCSIGLTGPHSLLRFRSDIVTRDIAAAITSTKSLSSCPSTRVLELSMDVEQLVAIIFSSSVLDFKLFLLNDFIGIAFDGHSV